MTIEPYVQMAKLNLRRFIRLSIVIFSLVFVHTNLSAQVDQAKLKKAKALFRSKCGSCHNASNLNKNSTGPALSGVVSRWEEAGDYKGKTGEEWLKLWIKNWNYPVDEGYPYAVKIKELDPSAMNTFPTLTDAQLDELLYYTENWEKLETAKKTAIDAGKAQGGASSGGGLNTNLVLGILILFLLLLGFILSRVTTVLNRLNAEKKGLPISLKPPFYKRKKFKTLVGVLLALVGIYFLASGAIDLGRQQGYQPEQPIKFSHKLHAGKHKIDCQYCHHAASEGKHSNIPSANICMNCHVTVQDGPEYGKKEIQKIYDAVDYDPETGTYGDNPKPIEWMRIHNLPDHVYFSHAQHVNAGGLECKTCHGPVELMGYEGVYQYAPLSMGWCINCHRNRDVDLGNDYYQIYEKYHEKLGNGEMEKVTVEDIGGTECQKCHY